MLFRLSRHRYGSQFREISTNCVALFGQTDSNLDFRRRHFAARRGGLEPDAGHQPSAKTTHDDASDQYRRKEDKALYRLMVFFNASGVIANCFTAGLAPAESQLPQVPQPSAHEDALESDTSNFAAIRVHPRRVATRTVHARAHCRTGFGA